VYRGKNLRAYQLRAAKHATGKGLYQSFRFTLTNKNKEVTEFYIRNVFLIISLEKYNNDERVLGITKLSMSHLNMKDRSL
jgi:hypothetical protein